MESFSFLPTSSLWIRITLLIYLLAGNCNGKPLGDDYYACNACRDSPEGERVLVNPSKSFTQSNGRETTCGELQEWVQDVEPFGGSPGEAELCGLTQYLAWFHDCDCVGPEIPPLDNVKELNPTCDMCGLSGLDFDFVPEPNREKLTDTGCCGKQNCEGLYLAAAKGVINSNLCPVIQQNSGPTCCSLGIVSRPLRDRPLNNNVPTYFPTTSTMTPSTTPTAAETPDKCIQPNKRKACVTTFGCSWLRKNRKRNGLCQVALETDQCEGRRKSGCKRKGCVWRKSDERCLGRWS